LWLNSYSKKGLLEYDKREYIAWEWAKHQLDDDEGALDDLIC
jgi:hypothetical protein